MSDVCLLLEGTYPYVTGGVSSCAHQLIEETPEIEYHLVFIGTKKDQCKTYKYSIPKNVRAIHEVFLFDDTKLDMKEPRVLGMTDYEVNILENSILFKPEGDVEELYKYFFKKQTRRYNPNDLFFSKEIWNILIQVYERSFTSQNSPSFIDFFYNWRFSNLPIFKILSVELPRASIYHSLCTGYAGLLGVMAKIDQLGTFLLTEHGIYTHERKIEISQSEWIHTNTKEVIARNKLSYFKEWWLNKFYRLGTLSYDSADKITTLFNGNIDKQVSLGAERSKIEIIANGINEDKLKLNINPELFYKKKKKFTIGLVGRVVPVKDIKTFIKSAHYLVEHTSDIEVLILGPIDEDVDYYNDCKVFASLLGLENYITFTDKVNLKYYYPSLDIIVLSSISEGQPLVLLEAYAFKIPAVTTDVGSCRELIEGMNEEDKAIGRCGYVVPFGRPEEMGEKILELLFDDEKRKLFGENAYLRFTTFYKEKYSINNYKDLYNSYFMEEI